MIMVVSPRRMKEVSRILGSLREPFYAIGEVIRGRGVVYK
jgi:hypothetical protein